jgi:hypothetical protein
VYGVHLQSTARGRRTADRKERDELSRESGVIAEVFFVVAAIAAIVGLVLYDAMCGEQR